MSEDSSQTDKETAPVAAPNRGVANSGAGNGAPQVNLPVRQVRKAYEQVYDQLRSMILQGVLAQGQRLPTEAALAMKFEVSRGTIREALRLLTAENLVRTVRGPGGGSFVTLPTVDHISEFIQRNIALLGQAEHLTLPEFLEMRMLIEVFAVRKAALQRTEEDLEKFRATLEHENELTPDEQYSHNIDFHLHLLELCDNSLLQIMIQPVYAVIHTHVGRSMLPKEQRAQLTQTVCREHREIIEAIEAQDPDLAERAMLRHLDAIAEVYREIWLPSADEAEKGMGQ